MLNLPLAIIILSAFLSVANCEKMCRRFICDSKTNDLSTEAINRICMYEKNTAKDLFKVLVFPKMCKESEFCDYYSILQDDTCLSLIYSICRPKPAKALYYNPNISYPGEPCDSYNVLYDCPYGRRQCYYGRCYGTYDGEPCVDSRDCMPGFYCDNGTTKPYEQTGKSCTVDESCGRAARCVKTVGSGLTKTCVPYFSVEDEKDIIVDSEYDVFLCKSMIAENKDEEKDTNPENPLSNFRTGTQMTCGKKFRSVNKGLSCYEYRCDVEEVMANGTTLPVAKRVAQCDCFMDTTGIPVCGPMNGDIEFDEYRAAFRTYLNQSKYCHPMRDFEFECGNKRAYYDFMCARAKVKHYYMMKASSCLYEMISPSLFPELYAVHNWCSKAAKYKT